VTLGIIKNIMLHTDIEDDYIDIRDFNSLNEFINLKPDFIFHFSALSLVRHSYTTPIDT
jgi:GDP-D-mannose dehydratase